MRTPPPTPYIFTSESHKHAETQPRSVKLLIPKEKSAKTLKVNNNPTTSYSKIYLQQIAGQELRLHRLWVIITLWFPATCLILACLGN